MSDIEPFQKILDLRKEKELEEVEALARKTIDKAKINSDDPLFEYVFRDYKAEVPQPDKGRENRAMKIGGTEIPWPIIVYHRSPIDFINEYVSIKNLEKELEQNRGKYVLETSRVSVPTSSYMSHGHIKHNHITRSEHTLGQIPEQGDVLVINDDELFINVGEFHAKTIQSLKPNPDYVKCNEDIKFRRHTSNGEEVSYSVLEFPENYNQEVKWLGGMLKHA